MNIIQIIPGSGGSFYCGNCLRDSKFVEAPREQGHQVVKIPMYLPLFSDEHDLGDTPVFYGAINIYLKQLYPIFRKAPQWFEKLLNSGPMLKFAAHMSGSTDAKGLEDMTVSMLLGEEGKQYEELERMINWIATHCKPDVIHLSNALLLGLAHRIKDQLNVPIICSLQDEDVWVDVMEPGYREEVWQLITEKAKLVDAFIPVSNYFADRMKKQLKIPSSKMYTIHLGVNPQDYRYINKNGSNRNIGFVSRLSYDNGLDIIIDAFILLKRKTEYKDVRLILTGGSTGADTKFIKKQIKKLKQAGLKNDYKILHHFEGEARLQFFDMVDMISVPVRNGEAFGLYILESMASGIPVIQPDLGAFPEIIKKAEGGIIYGDNLPLNLTKALETLLNDPKKLSDLSQKARDGVEKYFHIKKHSQEMITVYENSIKTKHNDSVS